MAYDFNSLTKQADEANNRDKFYTDFEDVDPNKLHQISELTDWMRTKAKGSDVREIIAQLFERTWLEESKEGNANIEVAKARGRFPVLNDRLNNADKERAENARKLAQKANKDEVTNVMTPKGTLAYASLPTSGNQVGWYYYCPDGDGTHGAGNYVWNGTSWYFGGTGDEGYNLLKKDIDNLDLYLPDLGVGVISNIYPHNFDSQHKFRVSTKNKIVFKKDTVFHVKDGYLVRIKYDFDEVTQKVQDTDWTDQSFCFKKGKEYSVSIRKKQEDTSLVIGLENFNEFRNAFYSHPLKELDVVKLINQIEYKKVFHTFLGHISDGKYSIGNTTTRAISNIFEYDGKILVIDKSHNYKIAYAEWNTEDNEYTTNCIWSGWNEKEITVDAKSGKKYCLHFGRIDNNPIDLEDLSNSLIVSYAINAENKNIFEKIINIDEVNKNIIKNTNFQSIYSECYYYDVSSEMHIEQDCVNLGDKYLFVGPSNENDTSQYDGKFFIMSKDLKRQKQLRHNLGHCASVDLSKVTGALIFANGSTNKSIKARLDILPDAISALNSKDTISLNDVISIDLDDSWYGLTACFGGSGDTCYILYSTDNTGNNCNIAQCKLGLGNSDLSYGGFGTFITGKAENEYNGTLRVVKKYNPVYLNVTQGVEFYRGKIWVMSSNDKVRAYQLQLVEDGNVIIENCYGFDQLSNDGTNVLYESEGMMHVDEHTLMTSIFTNHTPRTICLEV